MRLTAVLCLAIALAWAAPAGAEAPTAPEWDVVKWVNGDPGTVADNRGRVILVHFFQLSCAASNEFSQPLFDRWSEVYGEREDLLIVGIHTVFDDHDRQSPEHLEEWIGEKRIKHHVGIDRHPPGETIPVTMERYNTGGTPHVAMIDRAGQVRFDRFGAFEPSEADQMIETLLGEPVPSSAPAPEPAVPAVDQAAEQLVAAGLSGAYRLQFRQGEKTCGRGRTLVVDPLIVQAGEGTLTFSYTEPYLRRTRFTLPFDVATRAIVENSEIRVEREKLTVSYDFDGELVEDSDPPRFEFEIWMEIVGDEKGSDCEFRVKGHAERKQ